MCALRTTRPDFGGIWATGTWGQRYYAGHRQQGSSVRATRPDCGGIWGTGAWGMRFYGGHIQCGYVPPPVPPVPPTPDDGFSGSGGRRKKRILREDDRLIRREKPIVFERADESGDEEDIELILAMWLNLK